MKRAFWIALVFALILLAHHAFGADFRRAETFEDAFNASCRVSVSGARGSGTFIGTYGNKAYILTNYHVVTTNKTARLDFWTNGVRESIEGVVDWRYYDSKIPCDFARIVVDVDELKKIDPPYVALGGSDARPSVGAMIVSSGAPDGRFTQAWKGQILEYYNDRTCIFSPPPVPGQSGSGICEYVDGELFITGILTWLIGEKGRDDSKGGAIPIANLYQALQRNPAPAAFLDEEYNRPSIPADAVECWSPAIQTIAFYASDCKACDTVEAAMKKMAEDGMLEMVDAESERGAELARRYGVVEVPTVVVLAGGELQTTVNYTDLIVAGPRQAVQNALDLVTKKLEEDNPVPKPSVDPPEQPELKLDLPVTTPLASAPAQVAPQPPTPPQTPPAQTEPKNETPKFDQLPTYAPPTGRADFRNRQPVYEIPLDSGIFEDSDDVWHNRGSNRGNNQSTLRPIVPRLRPENRQQDPSEEGGEHNSEKNEKTINNRVINGLNSISGNISSSISAEISKMIDAQIERFKQLFITLRDKILCAAIFIIALGVLVADAIKALFFVGLAKLKERLGDSKPVASTTASDDD